MNIVIPKSTYRLFVIIATISFLSSCGKNTLPADLTGSYTGKERLIIRYDKGGQYIYKEDFVIVSLMIDKSGEVIGMAGNAMFEGCSVKQNRGWVARQLGIKTDFLIQGMLKGNTFDKDTIHVKDISIPFNIEDGQLKGSLVMRYKGESFPIISILKLQKNKK